jgi:hypothetical protein
MPTSLLVSVRSLPSHSYEVGIRSFSLLRTRLPLSRRDVHGYKMLSQHTQAPKFSRGLSGRNIVIYPLRIKVGSNKLSYSTNTPEQVSFEPPGWDS